MKCILKLINYPPPRFKEFYLLKRRMQIIVNENFVYTL